MDNIRKICKVVVFFCFIFSEGFAQNYNAKLWDYGIDGTFHPIEKSDGSLSIPAPLMVFQMDSDLNFQPNHPKYKPSGSGGDVSIILSNTVLRGKNYFISSSIDTIGITPGIRCHAIYQCDSNFIPLKGKKYTFDSVTYSNSGNRFIMATKSNHLLACGGRGFQFNPALSNKTVPVIFETDTNLNLVNSKVLYDFYGSADFVLEGDSGRFYVGLNLDSVGSCIMSFRENGQVDWIKSYIRPRGWMHEGLIVDGSLYVVGFTDSLNIPLGGSLPFWFDPAMYLMKIDTASGGVDWCKTFDTPVGKGVAMYSASLRLTHDHNLVMTCMAGASSNIASTLIIKTDLNGDTLWTRFMGYAPVWSCYPKTAVLNNGDLLVKGYYYGGIWQYLAYLYRLPPDGTSPCHQLQGTVLTGNLTVTDSLITMTEVNNVHTQKPAYLVADTPYVPLFVFDACMYLPVKENTMMHDESLTQYYPNPGKGEFNYPNPQNIPWTIQVYNAEGKKVLRLENQNSNPVQLNLQERGPGLYTITMQYKSAVITKKVMVEP